MKQTSDGSYTLYNEKLNEHYHSVTGAYQEALEKYFIPLQVKDGYKILDFCFGLGYNSFVATSKCKNLQIIALENDFEIINRIADFPYPSKLIKTVSYFKNLSHNKTIRDDKNNIITLILDDAKLSVKTLQSDFFDVVFFDPFSTTKIPDLWSKDLFKEIFRVLKHKGKLATYSCAKSVRQNMEHAGFKVMNGPSVGRKSPSTIAIKE